MVVFPIITSLILGWPFGYASTPYDARWAYINPRKAAWMAAAGPSANLLMMIVSIIVVKVGITAGFFLQPDSVSLTHIVDPGVQGYWAGLTVPLSMLFTLNLILFVLNLLPLPPLDGSNLLALFLNDNSARVYRSATSNPMFGFLGLFLAWQVFNPLFDVVFPWVINILYWGSHYA